MARIIALILSVLGWLRQSVSHALRACAVFLAPFGLGSTSDTLLPQPTALFPGSTATFFIIGPGRLLKAPVRIARDQSIQIRPSVEAHYAVERRLFERLGSHPRIIKYFGWHTAFPTGLLFQHANGGSLQSFLTSKPDEITPALRRKWFLQTIEAVSYVHKRGIAHSDLRPSNFLVHDMDIHICDFGGSSCEQLGVSGHGLPDAGFYDPREAKAGLTMDIFSLGSVLYTISTGHWPFREGNGPAELCSWEDMQLYESIVNEHFANGEFPKIDGLLGGDIIMGCWTHSFKSVAEIERAALELLSDSTDI
ncbi:kinase-like domain [Cordyceps militaris]|uniref:Kinase-like domain n=1 Tax=Cordyceps militaris TaxID=73501 RepID=A0A2H4SNB3_CORMI|nr:kinase-like domain [Cordyceps militaris]